MSGTEEHTLRRSQLDPDPFAQFRAWLDEARATLGEESASTCCLSTVGSDGVPQGRMVLLKGMDGGGFVFYTNHASAKGRALAAHPVAALTFYWEAFARQVRVSGAVEVVSDADADAYFATRPRGSQIGAWASEQSQRIENRAQLDARVETLQREYGSGPIPRPHHWSGFRIIPRSLEFWQGRQSRLHDRFVYERVGDAWPISRLSP